MSSWTVFFEKGMPAPLFIFEKIALSLIFLFPVISINLMSGAASAEAVNIQRKNNDMEKRIIVEMHARLENT
jgi:hypothetical protein